MTAPKLTDADRLVIVEVLERAISRGDRTVEWLERFETDASRLRAVLDERRRVLAKVQAGAT